MKIARINPKVRKDIDSLTDIEIGINYAFAHELIWYGVDAFAHVYIASMARDSISEKMPFKDFTEKYDIEIRKLSFSSLLRLSFPLTPIKNDGVFIPHHSNPIDRVVNIMYPDYRNRITKESWPSNKTRARELINMEWQVTDLKDPYLVNGILQFGKDMWTTCVQGFRQHASGIPIFKIGKQSQKVTDLGEKLIEYYSEIIDSV